MFVRRSSQKQPQRLFGALCSAEVRKGAWLSVGCGGVYLAATEELERVVASKMAARMDVYVLDEEDQLFNSYLIVVAEYRSRDHIRQKHNSPQLPTAANEHSSPNTVMNFFRHSPL